MAVGVIINAKQAEEIINQKKADLIAMGREMMYNPFLVTSCCPRIKCRP